MGIDELLDKYNLERETTARYIDAITRMNQSDTAEETGVSRQTVNRYKNSFQEMTDEERLLLISTLTQDKLLENATDR